MSVSQAIRGALQQRAATAVGFPPSNQRAYEGYAFNPTIGTTYARMTVIPSESRPAVVGAATKIHRGLFQIDIFYPAQGNPGTGAAEVLADAVKDVFAVGGSAMSVGGETVTVERVQREQVIQSPEWLQVPVTVYWLCYSPNN